MNYYDYGYGYDYSYGYNTPSTIGSILAIVGTYMLVIMAASIFFLVCMWKIYKKAGRKGWEALVPIYNIIVLLEIVNLPIWYIALFFVPFANIYAMFKIYISLAHKFGKTTGFGVLTVFFSIICIPILAFGSATYNGTTTSTENTNQVPPTPNTTINDQGEFNQEKRFCTNCGSQVQKEDQFCNNCGNKLQ